MSTPCHGQCLCGAVRISATMKAPEIQVCHCRQCQRWTGGSPLMTVRVTDVSLSGENRIERYCISAWGERAFCRDCGTTLFWAMQGKPPSSLAVGVLDDVHGLEVREEIFVDHRAGWLPEWADASQSTEAEEFAKLDTYLASEGRTRDG